MEKKRGRPVGIPMTAESKEAIGRYHRGVPKTEEQKHKMSLAKLGKPKTAEHAANMTKSHIKMWETIHAIMKANNCTCKEARKIYKDTK